MRKFFIVGICICVLVAFSAILVRAQSDNDQSLAAKVETLNKNITIINQKLDQILANQTKISEEIKTIKIWTRRN